LLKADELARSEDAMERGRRREEERDT